MCDKAACSLWWLFFFFFLALGQFRGVTIRGTFYSYAKNGEAGSNRCRQSADFSPAPLSTKRRPSVSDRRHKSRTMEAAPSSSDRRSRFSFFSIYSIIPITQMDLVVMRPRMWGAGALLKWLPIPWLSPVPPSGCFSWIYFCRRLEKSLHTLPSHCRLPSGDSATLRFGRSLKRFNGLRVMQTSIPHVTITWIKVAAADSAVFSFFSFSFLNFFSDHEQKYSPAMIPSDMANILAPGTEHVTHNNNHMIDWQCCKWEQDQAI